MNFDPQKHHRRSIRLKHYDYSQGGAYYVTVNVQNRERLFGEIVNFQMILNQAGRMVDEQWNALLARFPNMEFDVYQIMPNHFHGIIVLLESTAPLLDTWQAKKCTVGDIVGAFKSITTNEYIKGVETRNWPQFHKRLWQRNYYEHIVRDETDLKRIRDYIVANPPNWNDDTENPKYKNC
jgi:REP element-mobilizing transposase RayT